MLGLLPFCTESKCLSFCKESRIGFLAQIKLWSCFKQHCPSALISVSVLFNTVVVVRGCLGATRGPEPPPCWGPAGILDLGAGLHALPLVAGAGHGTSTSHGPPWEGHLHGQGGGGGLGCGARVGAFNTELLLALPRGSARLAPAFTPRAHARTHIDTRANTPVVSHTCCPPHTCAPTRMHLDPHGHVWATLCTRAR